MGIDFKTQMHSKTTNYGGYVDGIGEYEGEDVLFESKHIGASRYLGTWYNPLFKENSGYFWQAQAYLEGANLPYSLFVVTAQDSSAVKKMLTDDKRFNSKKGFYYDHDNEPPSKVYAFKLYRVKLHDYMDKRALAMMAQLEKDKPPERELDPNKDWQCMPAFCQFRSQCLTDGKEGESLYKLPDIETKLVYLTN